MSWTHVAELRHAESVCCDDGQGLSALAGASAQRAARPASVQALTFPEKRLSGVSASRKSVRPTLHHFGMTTANLEAMVDWYTKVLDTEPNHRPGAPAAAHAVSGWRTAWISNDQASHRIAIMALPGLTDDAQRSRHKGIFKMAAGQVLQTAADQDPAILPRFVGIGEIHVLLHQERAQVFVDLL